MRSQTISNNNLCVWILLAVLAVLVRYCGCRNWGPLCWEPRTDKCFPLKAWSGQDISMHTFLSARAFFFVRISTFLVHLPSFPSKSSAYSAHALVLLCAVSQVVQVTLLIVTWPIKAGSNAECPEVIIIKDSEHVHARFCIATVNQTCACDFINFSRLSSVYRLHIISGFLRIKFYTCVSCIFSGVYVHWGCAFGGVYVPLVCQASCRRWL